MHLPRVCITSTADPPEVLTSNPCLHNALLPSNISPKSIPTPKPLTLSPAAALSEPHLLSQPLTSCCTTRLSSRNGCRGVERASEAQLTSKEWLGANMGSGQVSPHRLHQLKVRPIGQENKQRHRWHEQSAGQRQAGLVFFSSVRSSYSHPDLLLTQHQHHHHPTFSDHTGPQHWTFTF